MLGHNGWRAPHAGNSKRWGGQKTEKNGRVELLTHQRRHTTKVRNRGHRGFHQKASTELSRAHCSSRRLLSQQAADV